MRALLFALLFIMPAWTGGNPYPTISAVPLPTGYHRVTEAEGSFGAWLRKVALKKGTTVYLYNGKPKENQDVQFAVLDVSVGYEDLQQCADAVMRMHSEQGVRLNFGERSDKGRALFAERCRTGGRADPERVARPCDAGRRCGGG